MTSPSDQTVQLKTGEATYLRSGAQDKMPVLLLNGGGLDCASLSWKYSMPELAQSYSVIAPNWPGYGWSTSVGSHYQIKGLAVWLTDFLEAL